MSDLLSRFGPYEIVGPLGAGGMGQVYRARDTRLQRNVALKVLHDATALDADRRRRFAQEAVAASALNHPNILTVYDIGVEGETPYLVSELIEGSSLRSEMNRGRMALRRIIDVGQQIAEGLSAAHGAGIVHRDLKPENVMVTGEGRVKIVDFGLAKVHDADSSVTRVPVTKTETAEGLVIGTVPYMSPEQARGEKADFRSDQFALGVMLYEMATAVHPFRRETAVQTLSAIIADDPPDPAATRPELPTAVRWLLRRLLAKKPADRYAHTADLATDLRNLREYLSEATSSVMAAPARRSRWRLPVSAAVLVAAGLALGLIAAPDGGGVSFTRYTPLATDAGYQKNPSWSPDGTQIAYEAEFDGVVQIFTRTLTSAMRTKITASAVDCYEPTWSADGYIYYHRQARDQHGLWRISPVGGEAQLVIEGAYRSAISPDGQTIAYLKTESASGYSVTLWFASPIDGEPRRYVRGEFRDRAGSNGLVRFSPDGSKLLVWMGPDTRSDPGFWLIPLPDGEPQRSLPGLGTTGQSFPFFSWLPDNRRIIFTRSDGPTAGTHLWMADTETADLQALTATPGNETAPSVSPDGRTIAFTSETTDYDLVEVPVDGSPMRPFLSSTRNEYDPAVSPANSQYAFVTDRTGNQQIWVQNEEAYQQQVLVSESSFGGVVSASIGSLAFSPDGRRLAFQRAADLTSGETFRGSRLWIASTSGGTPVPVGTDEYAYQDAPTWSPDGEWIAYVAGSDGVHQLVKERVGGRGRSLLVLLAGIPPFVARPRWSPDGRWILCETFNGLTVVAPDGSGTRIISAPGWLAYDWANDSRHIYGLHPTDDQKRFMLVALDSQTGAERVINPDLGLMPVALQPLRGFSRRKGGSFLTSIARPRSDIYLLEGFQLPAPRWRRLWPFGLEGAT